MLLANILVMRGIGDLITRTRKSFLIRTNNNMERLIEEIFIVETIVQYLTLNQRVILNERRRLLCGSSKYIRFIYKIMKNVSA